LWRRLGTADERVNAREQLGQVERLRDVVVRAALQAAHPRLEFVLRREQQHRRRNAAFAKLRDDAEAVAARQHDVEHDAAKRAFERTLQGAVTGVGLGNAVAFFAKRLAEEAPQIAVVFDEKYLHVANVPRSRGVGQCELDEKPLRISLRTSLHGVVPAH